MCYLENNNGIPVKISDLQLIINELSREDIRKKINSKEKQLGELYEQINKIQHDLNKLKADLRKA